MKRFRRTHRSHFLRNSAAFFKKNGQLVFLIIIIIIGATLGASIFSVLSHKYHQILDSLFSFTIVPTDFVSGCTAVISSAFSVCVLIIFLFLFGLTAYGCPLILLVLLFFGFWLGVAECYMYESGGILLVLCGTMAYMTISAIAVLIATAQALRMSCLFSRQLLPSCAHCGSMWQDFKMYLIRFMLCILIAFCAAVVDVLLKIFLI